MRRIVIALLAALAAIGTILGGSAAPVKADVSAGSSTLMRGLSGVSCVSATFCMAVGNLGDRAHPARGDVPLAMAWNGARWRQFATPLPNPWPEGQLDSVSCVSASYCVAVGEYGKGEYNYPLAETWNGGAWTATKLPRPAGRFYYAAGAVSCAVARTCLAAVIIDPAPTGPALAETLRGTTWTLRHVPLPKGGLGGSFVGVSCVAATYCVLAGGYGTKSAASVLFESWNGKTFTPMKADARLSAGPIPAMQGVSCHSANACTAVANQFTSGPFSVQPVAAQWNGKVWSLARVAGPKGFQSQLFGVSCAAAAHCVAAGVSSTNGAEETSHALAMSYDGRSWTTGNVPALPHGGTAQFQAVSCVSATDCVAVGEGGGPNGTLFSSAALTAFWNGTSWKLVLAS